LTLIVKKMLHQQTCKCRIKTWAHQHTTPSHTRSRKKAGGIILTKSHVLLVQSRGKCWGFPKGSVEGDETSLDCAKREIREETSIELDIETTDFFILHHKTDYYIKKLERKPYIDIKKIMNVPMNDCSGIAWFCIDCLRQNRALNVELRFNSSAKKIISILIRK